MTKLATQKDSETAVGLMATSVRRARLTDAGAIAAFFMQAWKEAGPGALGFTGATEEAVKEIASEGFLVRRLSSPKVTFVIAEQEGRIVGFASVQAIEQRRAELSGIVVLQGVAGKGIGTKLLRKACGAAARSGIERLEVKTEVLNRRAIGFYKKNKFVETRKITQKVGRMKVPLQVLERKAG